MKKVEKVILDPSALCSDADEFEKELSKRVVGQDEAIRKTTKAIQKYMAGFHSGDRPISNILLLGPTGTGKTRLVEAVCDVLFGDPNSLILINCAEFQESHSVSKIIGAPPGYVGHGEDSSQITQEKLNKTHTADVKLSVILLDEIEKAHTNFWDMLLGILDKGKLINSKGKVVDLTNTLIYMTSNLGAKETMQALKGGMGFVNPDSQIDRLSQNSASKRFSPEFMNRLDHVITFNHLSDASIGKIIEIELGKVQTRVLKSKATKFVFTTTDKAKALLLREGYSKAYGARYLKRVIEKHIIDPLVNLSLTGQISPDDLIEIDENNNELIFLKIPSGIISTISEDVFGFVGD